MTDVYPPPQEGWDWDCDCTAARLLRAFLESPEGKGIMQLATQLAVWKLRSLSHELAGATDWTTPATPYAARCTYEVADRRTPEEIRRDAYRSWGMKPPGY